MSLAVFPGTFDPVTVGHLDVLERARRLFERVTLAVAKHHDKRELFSLEERVALLEQVTSDMPGVSVTALRGLVVRGCVELGADIVVRGVRNASDLEVERQMAFTNRAMLPTLETVLLLPAPEHNHVSSTLVRQIALLGGDVSAFVPPAVSRALARRIAEGGADER